ncbi:MAG: DSD1 family PLP-dependent enzyme [Alphaproteobacteria bacterium]|nr:DSD1 family PLP-dependent enzyme [Alphaproteobacteria bacterium]
MPSSSVGLPKSALDTPALLVDLDRLESNIRSIAGACRAAGVAWRPHVKAVKTPAIAHMTLAVGAIGITCAKLAEAEVMAASGIRDILLGNQIVPPAKIARLVGLRRHADVMVAVDDPLNVEALAVAAAAAGVRLRVVIEMDIGIRRAGVHTPAAALVLARHVAKHAALDFRGFMGWEGHAAGIADPEAKQRAVTEAVGKLLAAAKLCRDAGLDAPLVNCGGTGTLHQTLRVPGVTEIEAGGGMFADMRYTTKLGLDLPPSLTLLTGVCSRPLPTRIICDGGRKSMSGDYAMPLPIGLGTVAEVRLSAEHTSIDLVEPSETPRLGDQVEFVVGYSDTTTHMHDVIYGVRRGIVETEWPLLTRGKTS